MKNLAILALIVVTMTGCELAALKKVQDAKPGDGGPAVAKYSVQISQLVGGVMTVTFNDGQASTVKFKENDPFRIRVSAQNNVAVSKYRLRLAKLNMVVPPSDVVVDLQAGDNDLAAGAAGDYRMSFTAVLPDGIESGKRDFQAAIECSNPAAFSVDPSGFAVSQSSGFPMGNVYDFPTSGISVTGGRAPYVVAFDVNGDLSRDTAFAALGYTFQKQYVNSIGDRKINIVVKDDCNQAVTVEAIRLIPAGTLPSLTPAGPQVYIHGQVTAGSGAAFTHRWIYGNGSGVPPVNYYATNQAGAATPVHGLIRQGANRTASATIASDSFAYAASSSVPFGMKIDVSGFTAELHLTGSGTNLVQATIADVDKAFISRISYKTDRGGDSFPASEHSGDNCTLSNPKVIATPLNGVPCAGSETSSIQVDGKYVGMEMTFEFGWSYVCTDLEGPGGSLMSISGDFYGAADIKTSCVGGGGQGGGGIKPPGV